MNPPSYNISSNCGDNCFSTISTASIPALPLATIRVEFHFVESDGLNFHCDPAGSPEQYAPSIVAEILGAANGAFTAPEQNAFGPSPQIPDARIRYRLAGDQSDPCSAIYFHSTLPVFTNQDPDVWPIIVVDNGRGTVGGQLGATHMLLYNIHWNIFQQQNKPLAKWGPVMNHEFGHKFGLCHAFSSSNTCPDMDPANNIDPNGAGFVYLNGAILENAVTAVSTSGSGSMSSDAYFGGLAAAFGTDFINNGRAVEFLKYGKENKSYLKNCEVFRTPDVSLNTVTRGASVWGCYGIDFEEVHFDGIREYGIAGINYSARITECTFEGSEYGIRIESTMPNVAKGQTEISQCVFSAIRKDDIYSNASPNMIYPMHNAGNTLLTGATPINMGIRILGESGFDILSNQVFGKIFGVLGAATGPYGNRIQCNTFSGNKVGARILYDNEKLKVFDNRFVNIGGEIQYVVLDGIALPTGPLGRIAPVQGEINSAAGNCFSNPVNAVVAPLNRTAQFDYYVPELSHPAFEPCLLPTNNQSDGGVNNYKIRRVYAGVTDCSNTPESSVVSGTDLADIRNIRAQYTAALITDPGNDSLTLLLQEAVLQQERILRALLAEAWESENYVQMTNLLQGEHTPQALRSLAGVRAASGDITGAQQILDTMSTATQDDIWFRHIMEVNLAAAQAGAAFTLSNTHELQLQAIADAEYSPMRGYACALLSWLKGYTCENTLPEEYAVPEERTVPAEEARGRLFPNPNDGSFRIELPRDVAVQRPLLQIFDQNGRLVLEKTYHAREKITVQNADLPNGVYWVRLYDEHTSLFSGKFIVIR